MVEINLMHNYPQTKRDLDKRVSERTAEDIIIAKQFGEDFFDGERRYGYGGYEYNPRFFKEVVRDMIDYYNLTQKSSVLDVGCAKGFMLYDFTRAIPGMKIRGVDISKYAIENAKHEVKKYLSVGNAKDLSNFEDKEFDLVTSITTLHNLQLEDLKEALKEIQRVGKRAFITLDAWRNDEEKERMHRWSLTAETMMHVKDWEKLFKEVGYTGDYFWFIT